MPLNGVTWLFYSALDVARCQAPPVLNLFVPQNQTQPKGETQLCQEALSCSGMRPFPRIVSGQTDMSTMVNDFQSDDTNTLGCVICPVLRGSSILTY